MGCKFIEQAVRIAANENSPSLVPWIRVKGCHIKEAEMKSTEAD
jgi:hypothetical protein